MNLYSTLTTARHRCWASRTKHNARTRKALSNVRLFLKTNRQATDERVRQFCEVNRKDIEIIAEGVPKFLHELLDAPIPPPPSTYPSPSSGDDSGAGLIAAMM